MAVGPTDHLTDAPLPKLLSLTAHEFRSPLTAVAGYIRMLLAERAGPVSDQQRRFLEEAERSCNRLSLLLSELSELSQIESGEAKFKRSPVDLSVLLAEAIAAIPALPDRLIDFQLRSEAAAIVLGDATRLKSAFTAVLVALRRELVTSDQLVVVVKSQADGGPTAIRITVGEPHRIATLENLRPPDLAGFDEWRGGLGMSLTTARCVLEKHGGRILAPALDGTDDDKAAKAAAVITIPAV
jgi:K+-sensing histidine kinase KdpD